MAMIRRMVLAAVAAAIGAAAAYLFDPDSGRARRAKGRDQLVARLRRAGRTLDSQARYTAGSAAGLVRQAASAKTSKPPPNDVALTRKVESMIFRPEDAPKGRVSVNSEDGVVFLRGEVETKEQIDMLVNAAAHVDGVREVRNLMHLPGTPAPSSDDPLVRLEQETVSRG